MESITRELLVRIGEDPAREGLRSTPGRVARSWRELTGGYEVDLKSLLNGAVFKAPDSDMVVVSDITFYSMCEHHLLPFFGRVHVAYIPGRRIIGLSKIPRLVAAFSRRLQVQERLTSQIACAVEETIDPEGVGVVIEARHLCMEMRGARSVCAPTKTSSMRGLFRTDARTRAEFLNLIGPSR
ncbi:MAG: GTP cyclohydrolase I FolE [Candidatus Coatesbacteria bacterium]